MSLGIRNGLVVGLFLCFAAQAQDFRFFPSDSGHVWVYSFRQFNLGLYGSPIGADSVLYRYTVSNQRFSEGRLIRHVVRDSAGIESAFEDTCGSDNPGSLACNGTGYYLVDPGYIPWKYSGTWRTSYYRGHNYFSWKYSEWDPPFPGPKGNDSGSGYEQMYREGTGLIYSRQSKVCTYSSPYYGTSSYVCKTIERALEEIDGQALDGSDLYAKVLTNDSQVGIGSPRPPRPARSVSSEAGSPERDVRGRRIARNPARGVPGYRFPR